MESNESVIVSAWEAVKAKYGDEVAQETIVCMLDEFVDKALQRAAYVQQEILRPEQMRINGKVKRVNREVPSGVQLKDGKRGRKYEHQ